MKLEDLIHRVEMLITQANTVLKTERKTEWSNYVDAELFSKFRSSALSFLASIYGTSHHYYVEFEKKVAHPDPHYTKQGRGILSAVRDEMAGGWLVSAKGLISAEIFADFLEMAEYLLSEDYKDAAAVMIGSVLEEHLRQLCQKHGVDIVFIRDGETKPKRANALNTDLTKAEVYNKLDEKNVFAWQDLRNKAAHGLCDEYTKEQVAMMLQGVTDFMTRNAV